MKMIIILYISDPKDIYIIQEPFESYTNNSIEEETIEQLETGLLEESRKYVIIKCYHIIEITF